MIAVPSLLVATLAGPAGASVSASAATVSGPRTSAAELPPALSPTAIPAATSGTFVGITPARLMDSRPGHHTVDGGSAGIGAFQPGQTWVMLVGGRGGVPTTAEAVVLNITLTGATKGTYVTVYPGQSTRPGTSNVNVAPGQTVAVASTVALGVNFDGSSSRSIAIYNAVGTVQVIIDVTGYYQGNGVITGGTFHPQTPARLLDTRAAGAIPAGHSKSVDLSVTQATAVAINITETGAAKPGYLSVWPGSGANAPATSTLNFGTHQTVANMAVVGTAPDPSSAPAGAPSFSVGVGGTGAANVIVDLVGWYSTDPMIDGGGLRFHALVPTRIVDTRSGLGLAAPLAAGVSATVTTPSAIGDMDTHAIVANLTGLGDASATYLALYPGPTVPSSSSLNLPAHGVGSNMVMTGLNADDSHTFGITNAVGAVQVIADVVGYFDAKPLASISLGGSLTTVAYDHAVTLTATVAANAGPAPAGTVSFVDLTDGGVALAVKPLSGLTASITTAALTAGAHQLVAEYRPTGLFVPASSTPLAVTVTAPAASYATSYQQNPLHDGSATGSTITSTLHQAWTTRLNDGIPVTSPLVANGRVFVIAGPSLYALSLSTGAILWGPIDVGGVSDRAALAYDGLTVFTVSEDGTLAAYSATDGSLSWSRALSQYAFIQAAPTALDGVVYVVDGGSFLTFAVSEVDGTVLWQGNADNDKQAAPVVTASAVYMGDVCPLNQAFTLSGAVLWQPQPSSCIDGGRTAALHGGKLYVRSESTGQSGSIISSVTGLNVGTFTADRLPAFDANNGYFLSGGTLSATSAAGTHLWSFTGDGQLTTAPVVANGLVFVESVSGTVFAVDVSTGLSVWSGSAGIASGSVNEGVIGVNAGLAVSGGVLVASNLSAPPGPPVTPEGATVTAFTN